MTTEEIVKAAYEAGFGSSEIFKRLAEFRRLIVNLQPLLSAKPAPRSVMQASEPRKGYGQTDEQWAASTLAEHIRARSNP